MAEAGGPGPPIWNTCPVDALKALGNVTIPRGEFWIKHRNMFLVKEISSASHIYGKKDVDAESLTTWRRWKDSPFDMKKHVDRAFCEGLNFVTFCNFASTRPRRRTAGTLIPCRLRFQSRNHMVGEVAAVHGLPLALQLYASAGTVRRRCLCLLWRRGA